jgi:hypothetical protein
MRVLGYAFDEASDARRAMRLLTERYGLQPEDVRLAELGGDGVVLGVRATEDKLAEVATLLRELRGRPVTDVDEAWTELDHR